ncbi:putative transcriptional regulator [Kribbella aluminosa]|uniref:Transcriptional regulator n=1 Tax=Kribbella aluminosa TaxID=416017 RepID=A0ABS4UBF5_9ACTN|nr:BlaI/MecI/CopY family transcriptional regulator [Kribbella aluminosa]MBP2348973.1 putative transcriptional regulator [Kribbella aluminosa]
MRGFGELEAAIMNRLWARQEPATVREVLDDLRGDREFAYTTVMTVLDNLHRKGWLTRQLDGRAYRYRPVSTKQEYSAELMRQALDGSGDNTTTLLRFVKEMTAAEAEAVERALKGRGTSAGSSRR